MQTLLVAAAHNPNPDKISISCFTVVHIASNQHKEVTSFEIVLLLRFVIVGLIDRDKPI